MSLFALLRAPPRTPSIDGGGGGEKGGRADSSSSQDMMAVIFASMASKHLRGRPKNARYGGVLWKGWGPPSSPLGTGIPLPPSSITE